MTQRDDGGGKLGEADTFQAQPDDTFEALLKDAAHVSGPALTGLGLRLCPGDRLRDERLRIERRIGEGGMGVVYEAFDEERGGTVALKTLSRLDAESVYRLKGEFRSLADVSHPNLCRLFELFSGGGDWFFSMELIRGARFDQWVRPGGTLDEARLRAALSELFEGVDAIHAAGKLHRDLKPSNVLVTEAGRVVVLDFGLVADPEGGVGQTLVDGSVSGTPAYMAPEQAMGAPATPASDLYALGVMLFEALTGRVPFEGRPGEVMAAKQHQSAPSAHSLAPAAPSDLDALCAALLAREQHERPSAHALRGLLARSTRRGPTSVPTRPTISRSDHPPSSMVPVLLGREAELEQLRAAYAMTCAGKPVVMLVSGESGMGKSALVSAFLDELSHTGAAAVLCGRCYERENVPFKGFDALVDDLSRYLRRLSREEALAVLPRDVFALARVFPVLQRVPVVAEAPVRPIDDPQELRRRAFGAFGELTARIRDRRPLCVFVDDLQWVDADSVLFMRALLVDRDPPPVLLVLSYRSEGAADNERLAAVIEVAEVNSTLRVDRLAVEPLGAAAAEALAAQTFLGSRESADGAGAEGTQRPPSERGAVADLARSVANESGGSPFFVAELARHAARVGTVLQGLSLSSVLATQLSALESSARVLLEVAALAGKPLPLSLLLGAAGASHDSVDELRASHLVRLDSKEQGRTLSCYHDRIRETVVEQLSAEVCARHYRALADTLLAREGSDAELLTTCLEGSGQRVRAAHFAAIAAARAEQGMAFDRAAELYQKALALADDNAPERHANMLALADALSHAGRGRESANAYMAAAAQADTLESIDLRRKAADELLTNGYARRGEQLMREVCAELGVKVPRTRGAALLQFGVSQARIRFTNFEPLGGHKTLTREERLRLELMLSLTRFAAIDPVLGAWASDQYLLHANAARDPVHMVKALALQAANTTTFTPHAEERIARMYALAERHAAPLARKDLDGNIASFKGTGLMFGRAMELAQAHTLLLRGRDLLLGAPGMRYELDIANLYLLQILQSDLPSEARTAAALIEEALSLGRVWGASVIAGISVLPRLATGDDAGAHKHLEMAQKLWSAEARPEMQWVEVCFALGKTLVANYRGDPAPMVEEFERLWGWFERSPVYRGAIALAVMHGSRGVTALSLARRPQTTAARAEALLKQVGVHLKALDKVPLTNFGFYKLAMRTGLALQQGDRQLAVRTLRAYLAAPPLCTTAGKLDIVVARRRLGQLLTGEEGRSLAQAAEEELRILGVADIERVTEMVLPGCTLDYATQRHVISGAAPGA